MKTSSKSLADFRRQIDEIDTRIHDLLMERADVVQAIGEQKGATRTATYQPAREAMLMRKLVARQTGALGKSAIYGVWREILGASIGMQGDFPIAALPVEQESASYMLAHDHFGSNLPISIFASATQILEAIADGEVAVGVLPHFHDDEQTSWWQHLVRSGDAPARIVGKLPFLVTAHQPAREVEGFVVALGDDMTSGDDHSLFVLDGAGEASRDSVVALAGKQDLVVHEHRVFATGKDPAERLLMLDLEGHVTIDDPRIGGLAKGFADRQVAVTRIGGYATPIVIGNE